MPDFYQALEKHTNSTHTEPKVGLEPLTQEMQDHSAIGLLRGLQTHSGVMVSTVASHL